MAFRTAFEKGHGDTPLTSQFFILGGNVLNLNLKSPGSRQMDCLAYQLPINIDELENHLQSLTQLIS